MSLDKQLKAFFHLIRDEAKKNVEFRDQLEKLFESPDGRRQHQTPAKPDKGAGLADTNVHDASLRDQKRGNRRPRALLDPIAESDSGEPQLRQRLALLSLDQLRDVVADFRMDPSKLVMKWKDRDRVVDHIVATAMTRRQKGSAFRS